MEGGPNLQELDQKARVDSDPSVSQITQTIPRPRATQERGPRELHGFFATQTERDCCCQPVRESVRSRPPRLIHFLKPPPHRCAESRVIS
jgi:hypothetical protein